MQPVPLHQPADALVAASNPYGDLCLDEEIERCTPHWAILFGNTSLLKDATKQEIVAVLNRQSPAIFHFAGHSALACRVDETAESWIVVASRGPVETAEAFGADELARHLVSARTRLAVLNSCWSGQLRGGSLLRAFVAAGVANVVAMNQPASDREAIEFAAAFYERLASNGSLEQAVTHARRRVCEHGRSSIAWGLPTAAFNAPALKLLPPFPS